MNASGMLTDTQSSTLVNKQLDNDKISNDGRITHLDHSNNINEIDHGNIPSNIDRPRDSGQPQKIDTPRDIHRHQDDYLPYVEHLREDEEALNNEHEPAASDHPNTLHGDLAEADEKSSISIETIEKIKRGLRMLTDNAVPDKRSVVRLALQLNVVTRLTRVQIFFRQENLAMVQELLQEAEFIAIEIEDYQLRMRCWFWWGAWYYKMNFPQQSAELLVYAMPIYDEDCFEGRHIADLLRLNREGVETFIKETSHDPEATSTMLECVQDIVGSIDMFEQLLEEVKTELPRGSALKPEETSADTGTRLSHVSAVSSMRRQSRLKFFEDTYKALSERPSRARNGVEHTGHSLSSEENATSRPDKGNAILTTIREPTIRVTTNNEHSSNSSSTLASRWVYSNSETLMDALELTDMGRRTSSRSTGAMLTGIANMFGQRSTARSQRSSSASVASNQIHSPRESSMLSPSKDVELSDTLAIQRLDQRVETSTGRRRSSGAAAPPALVLSTRSKQVQSSPNVQGATSVRRMSTDPLSPSPLRTTSFPEDLPATDEMEI